MTKSTDPRQLALDFTITYARPAPESAADDRAQAASIPTANVTGCLTRASFISPQAISDSDTRVISFVDATTMALRRNAVRRVKTAGIFTVGSVLKR